MDYRTHPWCLNPLPAVLIVILNFISTIHYTKAVQLVSSSFLPLNNPFSSVSAAQLPPKGLDEATVKGSCHLILQSYQAFFLNNVTVQGGAIQCSFPIDWHKWRTRAEYASLNSDIDDACFGCLLRMLALRGVPKRTPRLGSRKKVLMTPSLRTHTAMAPKTLTLISLFHPLSLRYRSSWVSLAKQFLLFGRKR